MTFSASELLAIDALLEAAGERADTDTRRAACRRLAARTREELAELPTTPERTPEPDGLVPS